MTDNDQQPPAVYLTIHCHFYQPPRENPWTDEIDREPSAAPYHDWNERISEECYRPNGFARIFDDAGRVLDIFNNYDAISFNFGPTLLNWACQHAPDVYDRLRAGDRAGLARWGHGNAIAQGYNHIIMPLANRRDKITQVRWGLDDFRHHFGRETESLWLPETAVDVETLAVMAESGLKFAILAPHQAARIRPLGSDDWITVDNGSIDPRRPYLCKLPNGHSIAIFFYDGPISHDISFGDTLQSSANFVARLRHAVDHDRQQPQLIHMASDGETFGHHKRYTERTLAYLLRTLAAEAGFEPINYGAYLERFPPEWEVEINDNTSWSCAHGIERWRSDCGCHTGGPDEWHQRWRQPLREALNWLRERFDAAYEQQGGALFGDPWATRDAFGVMLPIRHDAGQVGEFLQQQAGRKLDHAEQVRALMLLEMQRQAMWMYTSCGWFFNDVAGIETAQVLKYAARGIDLLVKLGQPDPTEGFRQNLVLAESNRPEAENAARVYQSAALPVAIDAARVAASYGMRVAVAPLPEVVSHHAYWVEHYKTCAHQSEGNRLFCGMVKLRSDFTYSQSKWAYATLHFGGYNLHTAVMRCQDDGVCQDVAEQLQAHLASASVSEMVQMLRLLVHPKVYGLSDQPPSDRHALMAALDQAALAELGSSYQRIYAEHVVTIEALHQAGMPVPPELRVAAEYTLSHRLMNAAIQLAKQPVAEHVETITQILQLAAAYGLRLDQAPARHALEETITGQIQVLIEKPAAEIAPFDLTYPSAILQAARRAGYDLSPGRAQELLLAYLRQTPAALTHHPDIAQLAGRLCADLALSEQVCSAIDTNT